MKHVSTSTLYRRYKRIQSMMYKDRSRFQPNPRGDGYLTKHERYIDLRDTLAAELRRRHDWNYGF